MRGPDPLQKTGPDAQRELFSRFTRSADGFSTQDAIGAALNVVVNALRQAHSSSREAGIAFDALFGRTKSLLMDHYDSLGRKRGIFPHDQTIEVPFFDARVNRN